MKMIETNKTFLISAVLPEDLAKTDNVKHIGKSVIRNTFYRSVSFMKKSFNRSNSSLSVASCDSSVGPANDDNMSVSSSAGTRSCLKGSRSKVLGLQRDKSSRSLRVRFKRTLEKVIKIEPFFEYAEELWYTKVDEREIFSQPGLDTVSDAANAEMYMKAYTQARKQVYPKSWFEGKEQTTPVKPEKLSTSLYDDIVLGRIHGFAGLEQYSLNLKKIRRIHIQQTVLMISAAYYDSASRFGSTDDKDKLVRSYAKSLTAVDRYWSAAMGQADADAAAEVYGEDVVSYNSDEDEK